ncbi:hemerythrin domain-containing protein [Homoserinimonas sp. OAct 916]|uniref:hemerythrin domain-containing protein n=1 Tax=Homoserinimonas sp. OAct 916 TaxID=2211450 RepID=UPI000DBE67E6|nr:hemerythrin domain-containing protein [Homoserinimonas sp. OAct 916]
MTETLATALEREHHEIDGGIEEYLAGSAAEGHPVTSLTRATAGLRRHIYLEEEFLFPPLRAAGMMMPIFVMLREHGELWRALDEIDRMLADGTAQTKVSNACHELLAMLDKHNAKEEPIIYSQADATLSAEASAALTVFLGAGRMPDGWVCHGAEVVN